MRGFDIVEEVGPPDRKAKKYGKPSRPDEEDMMDGGADEAEEGDDEGDREAAEVSAMDEYSDAMEHGTSEEKLKAFKALLDIVQP